jgi:uncharacterized protein (DUF4415 family)/uncharacterized DUF497 family protein
MYMAVTFDPDKNARNIAERGLSHERVADLDWDTALIMVDTRRDYGEPRSRVMARLDGVLHAAVARRAAGICGSSASAGLTNGRSGCMAKKLTDDRALRPDDDNPEWTKEDFANARPAADALPGFIGEKSTQELMRRSRGRPPKADKKVNQTLRLDADVVEAYRQQGRGWQARINEILRENMPRRPR